MTTRDEFLAGARQRLLQGIPDNPLRPITPLPTAPIAYAVDLTDRVDRFRVAAAESGAEIIEGADTDLAPLLRRIVGEIAPDRVAVADSQHSDEIRKVLATLGVEMVPIDDTAAIASADLGITGTTAGIALTGSVVIDTSQSGSRLASLLPDMHLALLEMRRILPTPGEFFRTLGERPGGLPSNLVLVTGPSRSADIELRLTIGVHGPRRVLVALL